jgi:hypothetical protein
MMATPLKLVNKVGRRSPLLLLLLLQLATALTSALRSQLHLHLLHLLHRPSAICAAAAAANVAGDRTAPSLRHAQMRGQWAGNTIPNFYVEFAEKRNKPMAIPETSAWYNLCDNDEAACGEQVRACRRGGGGGALAAWKPGYPG